MEPRANHVWIGAITLSLVVGMVVFGLWMVRFGEERDTASYDIVFREAVSGLSEGSRVEYNGLRVGLINTLRIDDDVPGQVIARISVSTTVPVNQSTRARIAMASITGSSHVQLSTDSLEAPPLVAGEDEVPVILAEPSPLARLRSNWEESVGSVNALLDNLNQLVSDDNIASVATILNNFESVSETLVARRDEVDQVLARVGQASETAAQAFESVDALAVDLHVMVERHGEEALGGAAEAMARLEIVLGEIEHLLSDNAAGIEQGVRGLQGIEPALRDFRDAVNTVDRATRRFDDNPAGYLFGGDRLPEFEP